jgi:KUP system potassium uptake protein
MHAPSPPNRREFLLLCLAALGVVYGDIGTSPLYAWNEIHHTGAVESPEAVLGVCSLVLWTLTFAVTLKYVLVVLRADNHGEGGTFALMGLVRELSFPGRALLLSALTFAACLLYAEGLLTPAISVVSAMEGLAVANPALEPLIVPGALAVLTALFAIQRIGTARLGTVFGLVSVAWFATISVLGARAIAETPGILAAVSPHHAVRFVAANAGWPLLPVLGSVVLAITGGEALYADIGHFGVRTIRTTWYFVVYPALLLAYLGQGAVLLSGVELRGGNVFYTTVPDALVAPMVVLSTLAAIIASQALISGAFSLTRSAIHLGLVPRVPIQHTSAQMEGQIYLPAVNAFLWLGCCALVVQFRSSAGLAGAYGLAVMGVMTTTTVSCLVLARWRWGWSWPAVVAVFLPMLVFDASYLGANVSKLFAGAWMPLAFGIFLYGLMWTWRDGRERLRTAFTRIPGLPLSEVVSQRERLVDLPKAFVFLVANPVVSPDDQAPVLLRKFVDRYGALPRYLTLFSIVEEASVPYWRQQRFDVVECGPGVVSVQMHVGFMEQPDVRAALTWLKTHRKIRIHAHRWTVVTGLEELVFAPGSSLRLRLFAWMMRWSGQATRWFGLGPDAGVSREVLPVRVHRDGTMELTMNLEAP